MAQAEDEALVRGSAARLYGDGQRIWDPADRWNTHKRAEIDRFAATVAPPLLARSGTVLDAGCGSEPYD